MAEKSNFWPKMPVSAANNSFGHTLTYRHLEPLEMMKMKYSVGIGYVVLAREAVSPMHNGLI